MDTCGREVIMVVEGIPRSAKNYCMLTRVRVINAVGGIMNLPSNTPPI